jgi:hypothetical protein
VAGIVAARLDHRGSSFYPQKQGAAMYSTTLAVLNDVRFYGLLLKFDQDLAAKVRKPRGGPAGLG